MTPKAEALLDGLLDACIDSDNISAEYQALVAYIEELERKASIYDDLAKTITPSD